MATITNVISTIFKSLGEDDVVNATNRIGRAQTRLGQASASSGRAFAAQASGLGGLVAAYAGAAATTFALQQAFDALSRAARAAQTIEGLGSLAAISGQDGKAILTSIQEITRGQITLTEAAQQANLSLSAGFNTKQIEGLAEVATKASRALGRDLNDAYIRVVRGSAKLETELLDELGIYTKIEPATRAYAAAIGKARTELTEYERRQAFANAVIEEGQRKFSAINTTIPTSAEQIEAFGATILNIATEVGIFISDRLAPLAAYLTNNLASAFAAAGIAASLVAGKAVTLLTAGFAAFTQKVEKGGIVTEKIIRAFTLTAAAADKANASIKALTASQVRLTGAQATQLTGLINNSQSRKLNTLELKESQKLINQNITALEAEQAAIRASTKETLDKQSVAEAAARQADAQLKEARAKSKGGGFGTEDFIKRTSAINTANAAVRRANKDLQANAAAYAAATTQITNNTVALSANKAALIALGPALAGTGAKIAAVLAGITAGIASVAKSTAAFGSLLLTVGSKVLFVGSLFTLLGGAFANAIGKGEEFNAFVSDLGATLKTFFSNTEAIKAKKVFKGVTVGALAELEKTDAALRNTDSFTFKKKFLFFEVEVTKTKEDLVNEVNSIISGVTTEKTFTEALTGRGAAVGGFIGALIPTLLTLIPGVGIAAGVLGSTFGRAFTVAAGAGIGAWIDSTLFSGEFDPTSPAAVRLRNQFADALVGFDEEVQNKLIQGLEELDKRYGALSTIDPRARVALRTQQQLLLASGEYLSNIEAVSQLMQVTGQQADVIAKLFDFAPVVDQMSYIQRVFNTLNNQKIDLTFIDVESLQKRVLEPSEEVTNFLNKQVGVFGELLTQIKLGAVEPTYLDQEQTLALQSANANLFTIQQRLKAAQTQATDTNKSILQVLGEGDALNQALVQIFSNINVKIEDVINNISTIGIEAITPTAEAINSYSRALGLVTFTQKNLNDQINTGSLTLETYGIGIGAVETATVQATQEYFKFQDQLSKLSSDEIQLLNLLGINVLEIAKNSRENLAVQQAITKEFKGQESTLKTQLKISEFLKSLAGDRKNILNLELEFNKAFATTPLDKFSIQLEYLSGLLTAVGDNALKTFSENRKALEGFALDDFTKQLILTTPVDRLDDLVSKLKDIRGLTAEKEASGQLLIGQTSIEGVRDTISAVITLQEGATTRFIQLNEEALEAIKNTVLTAIETLPQFLESALTGYKQIRDKIDADLRDLTTKEPILKLQFEIDRRNLNQQLAEIQSDARIARFESDIELIEVRKDLKEISPLQAAKQIAALEKNIIQERQAANEANREAERLNLLDREQIIRDESEARKEAIRRETQAQINKISQDVAYVSTLVQAYDTFIRDTDAVNNKLVRDFVAAGNAVADNFATTFENGATVFATAVQQATLGQFTQAGQVGTAPAAITTTAFSTTLGNTVSDFTIAAGSTISKLIEGEKVKTAAEVAATNRALELIGLEEQISSARFQNEYDAIQQAAALGDKVAQKRLQDIANETAQKSKTQQMIEELFTSIQSNIENTLTALNDFIFYGEGNFRDIIGNLFKSVQQDFFKTTIAKPLSSALTSSLFGALGIEVPAGGIEDAKVRNGALLVEIVDGPSKLFENVFKKDGEGGMLSGLFDNVSTFFSGLFGKNGVVANLFTGLFGSGGLFSSIFTGFGSIFGGLFGGVGSIFGSIFKGIFGLFGMAQGGMVHMASGGQLRDRVPALLEPGEFVIRKPMAREIGTPALQALNATGKVPASAPVINFKNEGTPKSVQSEQPRFDGEKYVIDIITRDLANNGPIRRTLRSGNL